MSPDELLRALVDPTAPLPTAWPSGALGVLLLFCIPIGGGIPFGVIMARDAGISPAGTAGLYLVSDLILAVTTEPVLALLRWLSKRIDLLARIGFTLSRLSGSAGLQEGGVRGPLGLILVAFSVSPTTGRAAAAAAGHGFVGGWTLAIIGDMAYFGVLMVTTLWVSSLFGDDRLTIGIVLFATWLVPLAIRRLRQRRARPTPRPLTAPSTSTQPSTTSPRAEPAPLPSAPRRRAGQSSRRRPTRGLHR